jgi:hypothetical protein
MIAKVLGGVLVLGFIALSGEPADADTGMPDPNPNPFAGLTCNCQEAPTDGHALPGVLRQGMLQAHVDATPQLPH